MSEKVVSVIIPAYNEGKNIGRMLRCMKRQTYENLEIIVINDGSTDDTEKVVLEYQKEDPRIRYIHKENGGVSSARNVGLDAACGDYVCFFDADDFVPKNAILKMMRHAEDFDADMVIGEQSVVTLNSAKTSRYTKRLSHRQYINKADSNLLYAFSLENRMFRRSVIEENHIRLPEYSSAEDGCFDFKFIYHAKNLTGCPSEVARYMKKPFWEGNSLSQSRSLRSLKDSRDAFRMILKYAEMIADMEVRGENPKLPPEAAEKSFFEGKDRYLSMARRRALNTCIKQFYRHIWTITDETYSEVKDYFDEFSKGLMQEDWDILLQENGDLDLIEGIRPKEYFMDHPILTVVLSGKAENGSGILSVKDIVNGIYNQDVPAFELLIDKRLYGYLSEEQKKLENIHVVSAIFGGDKAIREKAIEKARGEFITFLDPHTIPGVKSYRQMLGEIDGDDYISAPVTRMRNGEFEIPEIYERMKEDKSNDTFTYDKYRKADSIALCSKVFRLSTVRAGKDGFLKRIAAPGGRVPDGMTCSKCVKEPFITENEDFEI